MKEVLHQLLLVIGSWEGTVTKCLGVAQSIWQWQQQGGSESNNGWYLVAVPSFLLTSEVNGASGGAYLQTPIGGRPRIPLFSEMTAVVGPCHL